MRKFLLVAAKLRFEPVPALLPVLAALKPRTSSEIDARFAVSFIDKIADKRAIPISDIATLKRFVVA